MVTAVPADLYENLLTKWPIKITHNVLRGNHMITTMDIAPGEIAFRERSTAFIVRSEYTDQVCRYCLRESRDLIKCEECNLNSWCCDSCRSHDSSQHNIECPILSRLPQISKECSVDIDLLRIVLSIVVQSQLRVTLATKYNGSDFCNAILTPIESIDHIVNHLKHQDKQWIRSLVLGMKELKRLLPQDIKISVKELLKLASKVNSNSYGLGDTNRGSNTDVAFGLFPVASFMNHSCKPNCLFLGSSHGIIEVRALRPISAGEEILVSYIDIFQPTIARRNELLISKHFWCECDACIEASLVENLSKPVSNDFLLGIHCLNCDDGIYLLREQQEYARCYKCHATMLASKLEEFNDFLDKEFDGAIYFMRQGHFGFARSALERFLTLYVKLPFQKTFSRNYYSPRKNALMIHTHHHLVLNSLIPLLNCCPVFGDLQESIELHQVVLEIMENCLVWKGMATFSELADFQESLGDSFLLLLRERKIDGNRNEAAQCCQKIITKALASRRLLSGEQFKTMQVQKKLDQLDDFFVLSNSKNI